MRLLQIKFKGVLQSWGSYGGNLSLHPTEYKPTVSAILGMIAAALGIKRTQLDKMERLKDSLEIIVPEPKSYPQAYRDFQTVKPHPSKQTKSLSDKEISELKKKGQEAFFLKLLPDAQGRKNPETGAGKIIYKDYIVNQEYIVLVKSNSEEFNIEKIEHAIQHPYYPLFLGRKCCTASKIRTEIVENS